MEILKETVDIGGYTITYQFLLNSVILIIALLIVLRTVKKTVRLISAVVIVVTALVNFHILSQEDVIKVGAQLKELGVSSYEEYKDATDSIKVIDGDLNVITDQGWLKQANIKDVKIQGETAVITTKTAETYTTKDKYVVKLLKTLYSKKGEK